MNFGLPIVKFGSKNIQRWAVDDDQPYAPERSFRELAEIIVNCPKEKARSSLSREAKYTRRNGRKSE